MKLDKNINDFKKKQMNRMEKYRARAMNNYIVNYIGLAEGYEILLTDEPIDGLDVYRTYAEAKKDAIQRAIDDVRLVKDALASTRAIRKTKLMRDD